MYDTHNNNIYSHIIITYIVHIIYAVLNRVERIFVDLYFKIFIYFKKREHE